MKCSNCREEILQRNPEKSPYCGCAELVSKEDEAPRLLVEAEDLKKKGLFEEAALKYEELEMWDRAREIREENTGKVSAIDIKCPRCGAVQSLTSKSQGVTCEGCGKNYLIPKEVFELF